MSRKPPADVTAFFKKRRASLPKHVHDYFVEQGAKGGKLGGSLGGKKRAEALTPERRAQIAKKAAAARWGKKKD